MKRLSEYIHDLDAINKKRAKLTSAIFKINDKTVRKELKKAKKERERFIHNAHIVRFPALRELVPAQQLAYDPHATTIYNVFSIAEMAENVLKHFGPQELYIMTRVAKAMKPIVKKAFCVLAPYYLDRYAEDLVSETAIKTHEHNKDVYCAVLKINQERPVANQVQVEVFLSLWCHYMQKIRKYESKKSLFHNNINEKQHIDYSFVFDADGNIMRLSELNLYTVKNWEDVKLDFQRRWHKKHPSIKYKEHNVENPISLFNYKFLGKLDMERADKEILPISTLVMKDGEIRKFIDTGLSLHMIKPPPNPNSAPFFDYYEQRRDFHNKNNMWIICKTVDQIYRSSLTEHFAAVKAKVLATARRVIIGVVGFRY